VIRLCPHPETLRTMIATFVRSSGRFRAVAVAAILAVVTLSMAGCAKGANRPKTHKVSGTVTFKGAPLPKATVSFQPTKPGAQAAVGITDEAGAYTLTTFSAGDGAVEGPYQVAIVKMAEGAAAGGAGMGDDYVPPNPEAPAPAPKSLIPVRYGNGAASGLTANVEAKANTFDFKLD